MSSAQEASWFGLMDLEEVLPTGWTLDVKGNPQILLAFTSALTKVGFASAGSLPDGKQHRWMRGEASIDVRIPDGVGAGKDGKHPQAKPDWCPRGQGCRLLGPA